ncbi:MAG: TonB-dependent receptor, partial [Daejeonella sp.]|nr:TonB-dependent receptor [Daejeonella sp.]
MKALIFHIALLLAVTSGYAQQINGSVKGEDGFPLKNVSVSLKKTSDSSTVKLNISDEKGNYSFNNIPAGKYFITAAYTGYLNQRSDDFEVTKSDANIQTIFLAKAQINLKEVTITYQKPLIEVKSDKIVLNVENTINAIGQDALELLRKSPGVILDKDDNLSLNGKNGVQVYINGKPSPLSGTDLSEYLKSFQSSQIEAIEIISNPSSRYDAAGNAGIINIRLKKNKAFGTNGTLTAGLGMANSPKYNGGLTLNHRNNNINLFGSYSYNERKNDGYLTTYRKLLDSTFNQSAVNVNQSESHSLQGGADYILNQKNTIGILLNGTLSDNHVNFNNKTVISYTPTGLISKSLTTNTLNETTRNNGSINLNYRFDNTKGHSLGIDADYGIYSVHNNQLVPNQYFSPAGTFLYDNTYRLLAPTTIQIYSFKSDYERKLNNGTLGLGAK